MSPARSAGPPGMQRFTDKVVLVTGAARGQGRSHAVRLAAEGADVLAVDIVHDIDSVAYDLATPADLAETAELGGIDVVLANAGIGIMRDDVPDATAFRDQLDVNLTGVWNTVQAAAPLMIEQGRGGAVVLTSSAFGLTGRGGDGRGGTDGYVASKHGVVGLMRTFATWLGPHGIRVNCVNPTGVATRMVLNPAVEALFGGGDEPAADPKPTDDVANLFDVALVEVQDVTAAVAFLASEEARYVTGVALPVDAGMLVR